MESALLLMSWEVICVFMFISAYVNFERMKLGLGMMQKKDVFLHLRKTKYNLIKFILTTFILFFIFFIILFPELINFLTFFINKDLEKEIQIANSIKHIQASLPKLIYVPYIYIVDYIKFLLPLFIMYNIYLNIKNKFISVFLSIVTIISIGLITTSNKADSLFSIITLFIILATLYSLPRKFYILLMVISTLFITAGLVLKTRLFLATSNAMALLSKIIHAYFSGPVNVAVAVSMNKSLNNINSLLGDILSSLFLGLLPYDFSTSTLLFNFTFYNSKEPSDQIIPMIGQSYYYFGFLLSPILICLVAFTAIRLERISRKSNNYVLKYIFLFLSIKISCSLVLYNISIVIYSIAILFPIIILSYIYIKT